MIVLKETADKEKKKQLAKNREKLILDREGFVARSASAAYIKNYDKIKWGAPPEDINVDMQGDGFCDE